MNDKTSPNILLQFAGTGVAWGLGFLFIRVAMSDLEPAAFVFSRTAIATVVLAVVMRMSRRAWPTGWNAWRRIAILAVFGMAVPFLLYAWAGQRVPGGLSAIYNAAVPAATVLISVCVMRQERPGKLKLLGILVGGIGIMVVLQPWNLAGSTYDVPGQVACILAVLFLGFAFAYTRKSITPLGLDPIGVAAAQTLLSSVAVGVLLLATGGADFRMSPPTLLSVVAIGVLSTGFAYIWNFRVIEQWGAASASMVTYLVTIVGVFSGFIVLGEAVSLTELVGAALVFAGVALGALRR